MGFFPNININGYNPFAQTQSRTGKQVVKDIADPNVDLLKGVDNPFNNPQPQVRGASTTRSQGTRNEGSGNAETPPTLSGTGSGGGSSYNPADLAYLDSQSGHLRDMLGRSQVALNQGLTGLDDSYNREVGSANQQRSRALENYGVQREDSTRAKQEAVGQVDTNARVLNDSLRRILGMAAGSDSSAYQYAAP